jgi:hypothetical protein
MTRVSSEAHVSCSNHEVARPEALFCLAAFGNVEHLGATLPGLGYANWQALLMEVALTAGLVSVILGTASLH